jgi:hypothetical protein
MIHKGPPRRNAFTRNVVLFCVVQYCGGKEKERKKEQNGGTMRKNEEQGVGDNSEMENLLVRDILACIGH